MNAVLKSQAVLVSSHGARIALSVAIAAILGRNLAPEDFGFVALVSSIFLVAVEILDMGTIIVATRQIAARPEQERETLTALIGLRRLLSMIAFASVLVLACTDYVSRQDQRLVLVAAAFGIFLLHLQAYQPVFHVRQAYGRLTALALGGQLGFLLASAAAMKLLAGGAVIGLLVVAREIALVLGTRWMAVRALGYRLRAPWTHPGACWPLLRAGWMIGVAGLSYKLATYSGGFILWELSSPEALASFSAAQRLLVPMGDMAWLFVTPLIAAMSASVAYNADEFRVQLEGYVKLLLGMSSLAAVAGFFLAPLVLRVLYGEMYVSAPRSAVGSFRWLALGYLFAVVSPVMVVGEMARGNTRALMFTALACLAANLAGNAWAIPRYGADGAAMAMFASEACVFLVLLARCVARRDVRLSGLWAFYLVPASLLGMALWLLAGAPVWQLAVACAWVPASLFAITQLPAQRACRASVALTTAQWKRAAPPPGALNVGDSG